MIYYTGDIHGDPYEVIQFCDSKKLTEQDTLVLLGDVGANYYRNRRDTEMKKVLTAVKPTMLCIHGNHEIRPASLPSYRTKQWNGGTVWVVRANRYMLDHSDFLIAYAWHPGSCARDLLEYARAREKRGEICVTEIAATNI